MYLSFIDCACISIMCKAACYVYPYKSLVSIDNREWRSNITQLTEKNYNYSLCSQNKVPMKSAIRKHLIWSWTKIRSIHYALTGTKPLLFLMSLIWQAYYQYNLSKSYVVPNLNMQCFDCKIYKTLFGFKYISISC